MTSSLRTSLLLLAVVLSLASGDALAKARKKAPKPQKEAPKLTSVVRDADCTRNCTTHRTSCEQGCSEEQGCLRRCVNHFNDCSGACTKTVTEAVH